jgi:hypothetical protein
LIFDLENSILPTVLASFLFCQYWLSHELVNSG